MATKARNLASTSKTSSSAICLVDNKLLRAHNFGAWKGIPEFDLPQELLRGLEIDLPYHFFQLTGQQNCNNTMTLPSIFFQSSCQLGENYNCAEKDNQKKSEA